MYVAAFHVSLRFLLVSHTRKIAVQEKGNSVYCCCKMKYVRVFEVRQNFCSAFVCLFILVCSQNVRSKVVRNLRFFVGTTEEIVIYRVIQIQGYTGCSESRGHTLTTNCSCKNNTGDVPYS